MYKLIEKGFSDFEQRDCCVVVDDYYGLPLLTLGVLEPQILVPWNSVDELKRNVENIQKDDPLSNENGWCTIHLPPDGQVESLMLLNISQVKSLIKELNYFVRRKSLSVRRRYYCDSFFTKPKIREFEDIDDLIKENEDTSYK